MIRSIAALAAVSLCIACAGHAESAASDPGDDTLAPGRGGSGPAASAGEPNRGGGESSFETGGSAPRPGGDGAGVSAQAGAASYVPHIESGTRSCENADFCFGLSCYAPPSFEPAVCVERCETDADCEPFEACVSSSRLAPTCYARCDSPSDCARHFDCLDFSGTGELVCFPTAWAARHSDLE